MGQTLTLRPEFTVCSLQPDLNPDLSGQEDATASGTVTVDPPANGGEVEMDIVDSSILPATDKAEASTIRWMPIPTTPSNQTGTVPQLPPPSTTILTPTTYPVLP